MKSFSPEQEFTSHRSEERLPEVEEALYEALVPEIKAKAIRIEDFTDHYGEEAVRRDQEYLRKREAEFGNEKSSKFGALFEAIVDTQIEDGDLMGPKASVIVPSRYDDVANGIDSIVEFSEGKGAKSHLALAIDVTKSKEKLAEKFDRVRDSIQKGQLSHVKYFHSKAGIDKEKDFRGRLGNVPRVVVGAGHETVDNISDLILRQIRMKKTIAENRRLNDRSPLALKLIKDFSAVRQELAAHPLQYIVLTEIREELAAFRDYAEKEGKAEIAEQYSKLFDIVEEIIKEKEEDKSITPKSGVANDEVYDMIMQQAKLFASGSRKA